MPEHLVDLPLIDLSQPYCITLDAARSLVPFYLQLVENKAKGISIREPVQGIDTSSFSPRAIEWQTGESLGDEYAWTVRDGVATINMQGPIIRYGSIYSALSGVSSTGALMQSIRQSHQHKAVTSLLIVWNSPGGDATSISEGARLIASLRGQGKPIISYVDGMCCSAAYWLASACDEIVSSDTGESGSIGAVGIMSDMKPGPGEPRQFIYRNSQSPKKFAAPGTKIGDDEYQRRIDALAQVFAEGVAQYRGVTVAKVWKDFGQGGVLMGAEAVSAGLCDRLGDYEEVVTQLSAGYRPKPRTLSESKIGVFDMKNQGQQSALAVAIASALNAVGLGHAADASDEPDGVGKMIETRNANLAAGSGHQPSGEGVGAERGNPPSGGSAVQPPPPTQVAIAPDPRIAALEAELAQERQARVTLENANKPTREAQVSAFMGVAKPKVAAAQHAELQTLYEAVLDGKATDGMLTTFFSAMEPVGSMQPVPQAALPEGAKAIAPPAAQVANDDGEVDLKEVELAKTDAQRAAAAGVAGNHQSPSMIFVPGR